jgi:hypothetical protein
MRILGHVTHPVYQITVFKMDMRLSIQFEYGKYAQIYKFDQVEKLGNLAEAQAYVTPQLLSNIANIFENMHISYTKSLAQIVDIQEDTFDEII